MAAGQSVDRLPQRMLDRSSSGEDACPCRYPPGSARRVTTTEPLPVLDLAEPIAVEVLIWQWGASRSTRGCDP